MDKDNSRPASGGSYTRKSASDKPVLRGREGTVIIDEPAFHETKPTPSRVSSGKKE